MLEEIERERYKSAIKRCKRVMNIVRLCIYLLVVLMLTQTWQLYYNGNGGIVARLSSVIIPALCILLTLLSYKTQLLAFIMLSLLLLLLSAAAINVFADRSGDVVDTIFAAGMIIAAAASLYGIWISKKYSQLKKQPDIYA